MHGLDWYDYGARNYEPVLSRFTTPDPLAEKYYSISPYAYCAGNPVMFVDPDGRDWIASNREGKAQFEWRDDINAESILPEGYTYVDSLNSDILTYLGIEKDYESIQTNTIGMIASDAEVGKYSVSHLVNIQESTTINIQPSVSFNENMESDNNKQGIIFNGLNVIATNISKNSGVDGKISSRNTLSIDYGTDFISVPMKSPNYTYLHNTGTFVTESNVFISQKLINKENPFSIKVKGNWWVSNSGRITPVVLHSIMPVPKSFLHQWKIY